MLLPRSGLTLAIYALTVISGSAMTATATAQSTASAAGNCGAIFAKNYFDGKDVGVVALRGVDCRTARQVLRYYYNSGAPCSGSGCVLTTPSGWLCETNPGEVQQRTTIITVCRKGHGVVESRALHSRPVAQSLDCRNFHAGKALGDGEYSDGAMISATGISCGAAFSLIRPQYSKILRGTGPFMLGKFSCTRSLDGPDTLKTCVDGAKRFQFL